MIIYKPGELYMGRDQQKVKRVFMIIATKIATYFTKIIIIVEGMTLMFLIDNEVPDRLMLSNSKTKYVEKFFWSICDVTKL